MGLVRFEALCTRACRLKVKVTLSEDRLYNVGPKCFLTVLDSVPKEETWHLALVRRRAWTARNKVTRAGETLSIHDSVCYLTKLGNSLNELKGGIPISACSSTDTASNSERRPQEREALWIPPDRAAMKINVDEAFNSVMGIAAVGAIVQDHEGQPHAMAWCMVGPCRDAEEAEALAMLEGLRLAE
jgi:hypothetical protein